jgi:hypothetical protein
MVRNTPMVRDPGFYAFSIAAAGSVVGKAYVLGEWSVPSPNQYASEQGIIPAVYAAYQDWDGIFFTPYATRREELFADTIIAATINTSPWNNIVSNHALMAQMPFASYVFRMGLVPPSTIFDTIQHDPDDVFLLGHFPPASYRGPFGQDGFMYGDQTVVSAMEVREKFDTKSHTISTYSHDYTDPLFSTYDSTATNSIVLNTASGTFAATEPNLYAFTGFLTDPFSFPTLKIERLDQSGDNLSMYYIFADSEKQGRLSLSTRTQNTGVQWIDSLGYGANVGHAPTIMSAANVRLTFQSYFDSVMLYPLDASGLPAGQMILATRVGSTNKFTATIDQLATHSVWFVVRQAGTGGVDAVKDLAAVLSLDLSISPNPTPARATILLNLLEEEHVTLSLTDDLGREVWRTSANFAAGHSRLPIDVSRIPSGMYVLRMMSGAGMMARGFSVVR